MERRRGRHRLGREAPPARLGAARLGVGAAPSASVDAAMAGLAQGDRTRFTEVFATVWPVVRRRCIEWLDDVDEGEDAAQRAMISLMSKAHDYRKGESTVAWALAIAMWECRTVRRRRQRSRLEPIEHAADTADLLADPEHAAMAEQMRLMARRALEELSPEELRTLVGAIAQEVGPASPAQRKRKQRLLDKLRSVWRRLGGP